MELLLASPLLAGRDEFEIWWQRRGEWVEEANQRRGGQSGVQRLLPADKDWPPLYCKRQTGHIFRSLRYPLGRPTILREALAYQAFARLGITTPRLVYAGIRKRQGQWQALLVTEALDGFVDLADWYQQSPDKAQRELVLSNMARTLAHLHRAGWRHGCLYDKHLFIHSSGKVALLDLEKSRRPLLAAHCAKDLEQLARHSAGMPMEDLRFLQSQYQALLR